MPAALAVTGAVSCFADRPGFDFHSVREYEQGESLRRVHWPTSARRGQLMVKELEDTANDGVVVMLDCDPAGAPVRLRTRASTRLFACAGSSCRRTRRADVLPRSSRPGGRAPSCPCAPLRPTSTARSCALAAAEPDALDGLARFLAGSTTPWLHERGARRRDGDDRADGVRAARPRHATARLGRLDRRRELRGSRPTRAEPGLLRLAAHGIPAAVVRHGDDLAAVSRPARVTGGRHVRRTLRRLCALPALAISLAWLSIEEPVRCETAVAVAALALCPRSSRRGVARLVASPRASLAPPGSRSAHSHGSSPVPRRARPRTGAARRGARHRRLLRASSSIRARRGTRRCTRSSSARSSASSSRQRCS